MGNTILHKVIIFLLFSGLFRCQPAESSITPCEGDCKVKLKIMGIFPLRGEERHLNSPLNKFSWKWFYLYSDHMSIFKSSQKPPNVNFILLRKKVQKVQPKLIS